ncbi:SseB family protein [Actinomycetaceae bacterium L2_0104]
MVDFERLLRPNPFSGDDGGVQPQMAAALELRDPAQRQEALVAALGTGRVFVPVQAHAHPGVDAGDVAEHDSHNPDKVALEEASQLSVSAPGGLRAMPVFSSAASLTAFDPGARPVPLLGRNAAAQALLHTGLLALDPVGSQELGGDYVGRSGVLAIAADEAWLAPWIDPQIPMRLEHSLTECEAAQDVRVLAGRQGVVRIAIVISDFAGAEAAREAVQRVTHALQSDDYLKSHLDLVEIVPVRRA